MFDSVPLATPCGVRYLVALSVFCALLAGTATTLAAGRCEAHLGTLTIRGEVARAPLSSASEFVLTAWEDGFQRTRLMAPISYKLAQCWLGHLHGDARPEVIINFHPRAGSDLVAEVRAYTWSAKGFVNQLVIPYTLSSQQGTALLDFHDGVLTRQIRSADGRSRRFHLDAQTGEWQPQ